MSHKRIPRGCECPLCGTSEPVRGFKVHDDEFGWWSQCTNEHDFELCDGNRVQGQLWFAENTTKQDQPATHWVEYVGKDESRSVYGIIWELWEV